MAQSTIQEDGRFIEIILLKAVESGFVVHQHQIIGVALTSGIVGEKIAVDTEGVHILPAVNTVAFIAGEELHWDGSKVTNGRSQNVLIGTAYHAKDALENTAQVKLHSFLTSLGGTVTPEEMESSVIGGIITYDSNKLGVIIEPGVSGKVLTSNGPRKEPTYESNVGGSIELNEIGDDDHGGLVIINSTGTGGTISPDTLGKVLTANGVDSAPSFKDLPVDNIGANAALSNLSAVAISLSLLPGFDKTIDLGSASKRFKDVHADTGKFDSSIATALIKDTNGNTILNFSPVAVATNFVDITNGIDVNQGSVTIGVSSQSLNTNLDIISKGNASEVRFSNDLTGGKLGIKSNLSTAGKTLTLESKHTDDRTIILPDANTTLIGTKTENTLNKKSIVIDDGTNNTGNSITNLGSDSIRTDFISGQTPITSLSNTDELLVLDKTNTVLRKTTIQAISGITFYTDSGASNLYRVLSIFIGGIVTTGQVFYFKASNANTGTSTFQVNDLTAIPILKRHDQVLISGDIESGQVVQLMFDGTNFQMLSPANFIKETDIKDLKSYLTNIEQDTNPKLGGNLDINGKNLVDSNGKTILDLNGTANAVNFLQIVNAHTGRPPQIFAVGDDDDIELRFSYKGASSHVFQRSQDNAAVRIDLNGLNAGVGQTMKFVGNAAVFTMPSKATKIIGDNTTNTLTKKTIVIDDGTNETANSITNLGSDSIRTDFISGQTPIASLTNTDELLVLDKINTVLRKTTVQAISGITFYTDSGASNLYRVLSTFIGGIVTNGQVFYFKASNTNTGTSTFQVNDLTAIPILKRHDQALVGGDIESGQVVQLMFDGTNFQMLSPANFIKETDIKDLKSYLTNIVEDLTPKLGGDLNINNKNLVDINGNTILSFRVFPNAVNHLEIFNSSFILSILIIAARGSSENIELMFHSKGTGFFSFFSTHKNARVHLDLNGLDSLARQKMLFVGGDAEFTMPTSSTQIIGDNTTNTLTKKTIVIDDGTNDTANSITNLGSDSIRTDFISGQTDATVSTTDSFIYSDSSDSGKIKKDTVQGIVDLSLAEWSFVESRNVTYSPDIRFTNLTGTGQYRIVFSGLKPSKDANLSMRVMIGSNIIVTDYQFLRISFHDDSTRYAPNNSVMQMSGPAIGADRSEYGASGSAIIGPFNNGNMPVMVEGRITFLDFNQSRLNNISFAGVAQAKGGGRFPITPVDGFMLIWSDDASFSLHGNITLYKQVVH